MSPLRLPVSPLRQECVVILRRLDWPVRAGQFRCYSLGNFLSFVNGFWEDFLRALKLLSWVVAIDKTRKGAILKRFFTPAPASDEAIRDP